MNWLLIGVVAVLLAGAIIGLVRGGIRIAVSLAATLVTILLVFIATPYVSKAIVSLTPMDDMIESQCYNTMKAAVTTSSFSELGLDADAIRAALEAKGISEKALERAGITVEDIAEGRVTEEDLKEKGISVDFSSFGVSEEEAKDAISNAEIPRKVQMAAIDKADLPKIFKSLLKENNNSEVYNSLGVESFADYVAKYLSKLIVGIVAFLVTFLLVTIIIRAIIFALDIVSELPVLGAINRVAGLGVGLLVALLFVDVLFLAGTLLYVTPVGQEMFRAMESSKFLSFLYDHNFIMGIATKFR